MTIAGHTFTVDQAGQACTYTLNPTSMDFSLLGGVGTVSVSAPAGCSWTAHPNDGWILSDVGTQWNGQRHRRVHGGAEPRWVPDRNDHDRESHVHRPAELIQAPMRRSAYSGTVAIVATAFAMVGLTSVPAAAQQTVSDVLTFLLTNRSIPTDDFIQDSRAAAATAETFSAFLLAELGTLPVGSSASGFSYRLNRTLGASVRSSDSFGPIFIERSLTAGEGRTSFAVSFQSIGFDRIDGRPLRDGTLVSVASRLAGDTQPFDVETVSLRLSTDTVLLTAGYGVSDRLDVSATLPMIRLSMSGERVDTYRGRQIVQATATATASGIGDAVLRAKYNVVRNGASGVTVGSEMRVPIGDDRNLLGTGEWTFKPRVIGSLERDRVALHGDLGYMFGGLSGEMDYGAAVTVVATPRVTVISEFAARRLGSVGRLAETTQAHPLLDDVETVRLTSVRETTHRAVLVFGLKWNVAGTGILGGHVMRPVTSAGLNSRWMAALTFDYSFEY